jgi:hypothetical protein
MGLAWVIVGIVEWASSRERFARTPVPAPARPMIAPAELLPLRVVHAEPPDRAEGWEHAPAAEQAEQAQQAAQVADEELTVVEAAAEDVEGEAAEAVLAFEADAEPAEEPVAAAVAEEEPAEAAAEPVAPAGELEPEPAEAVEEPEAEAVEEPEPEVAAAGSWSWAADAAVDRAREREQPEEERPPRRWFWQRRKQAEDGYRFDPTQPRHVRVLPPAPSFDEQFPVEPADGIDPWERDLDLVDEAADLPAEPEAGKAPEHAYAEARPDGDAGR